MNKAIISFVISALVGLAIGYFVFVGPVPPTNNSETASATASEQSSQTAAPAQNSNTQTASAGASSTASTGSTALDPNLIIVKRGCVQCHSVSALNIHAGQVGPDLSHAYVEVKDKHGMPIEQFLTKPNSAVMSGVLGSNPLTDDQRKQVIALLKKASEVKQ